MNSVIHSHLFCQRHKRSPQDFTRNRKLTFPLLILFFINQLKSSLQTELDSYFRILSDSETPVREVTKGALSQARQKLRHQAFIELNDHMGEKFYATFNIKSFQGYRLLAIDGTTLQLPNLPALAEHFGGMSFYTGDNRPMARVSQLYDLRNKFTVDAAIRPYSHGERDMALLHSRHLTSNDLVIYDRGYPAFWLFAWHRAHQIPFCARVAADHWSLIKQFVRSGQTEAWIDLEPTYVSKQKCRELGLSCDPIRLRLIRVDLESNDPEILITSLLDPEQFPESIFQDLYHERWGVEESYKAMKCRIQLENFTGKSVEAVYLDFYARVFMMNLTAVFVHPAQDIVDEKTQQCTHSHQVNFAYGLSALKDSVIRIFRHMNPYKLILQILDLFMRTTEVIRPNRSYPRIKRMRDHPAFYLPYKQGH